MASPPKITDDCPILEAARMLRPDRAPDRTRRQGTRIENIWDFDVAGLTVMFQTISYTDLTGIRERVVISDDRQKPATVFNTGRDIYREGQWRERFLAAARGQDVPAPKRRLVNSVFALGAQDD